MTNAAQLSSAKQASSARPAEPILASQLISDEELDDLLETVCNSGLGDKTSEKERLGTGVKSLDDTLGGGFESGRIIAISGEAGAGANEVSSYKHAKLLHWLAWWLCAQSVNLYERLIETDMQHASCQLFVAT